MPRSFYFSLAVVIAGIVMGLVAILNSFPGDRVVSFISGMVTILGVHCCVTSLDDAALDDDSWLDLDEEPF